MLDVCPQVLGRFVLGALLRVRRSRGSQDTTGSGHRGFDGSGENRFVWPSFAVERPGGDRDHSGLRVLVDRHHGTAVGGHTWRSRGGGAGRGRVVGQVGQLAEPTDEGERGLRFCIFFRGGVSLRGGYDAAGHGDGHSGPETRLVHGSDRLDVPFQPRAAVGLTGIGLRVHVEDRQRVTGFGCHFAVNTFADGVPLAGAGVQQQLVSIPHG